MSETLRLLFRSESPIQRADSMGDLHHVERSSTTLRTGAEGVVIGERQFQGKRLLHAFVQLFPRFPSLMSYHPSEREPAFSRCQISNVREQPFRASPPRKRCSHASVSHAAAQEEYSMMLRRNRQTQQRNPVSSALRRTDSQRQLAAPHRHAYESTPSSTSSHSSARLIPGSENGSYGDEVLISTRI